MKRNVLPTSEIPKPRPLMREVLEAASELLTDAEVTSPRVDAELLASHVCKVDRASMMMLREFPRDKLGEYWELIERRARREPLQHLTGEVGFRYLTLEVRPGVFVPRPETEMVAEVGILAAKTMTPPARIVDLCTGAGGIAVSAAYEVPRANVWAVDVSAEAVLLTRANAAQNLTRLTAVQGDVRAPELLADLHGHTDVVISNPPYIPFDSEPIETEVRDYDPPAALYGGGQDGLEVPGAVVDRAHALLRAGGVLVIEHGDEQGEAMQELVRGRGGFKNIHTRTDLAGRDRMVVATRVQVAH